MVNSLQLWPFYRDTWGYYDAVVNAQIGRLDHSTCYRPKYYNAPDLTLGSMSPGAYQRYTLGITPGSLIVGFYNDDQAPLFTVQVTDLSTSHQFWDGPISNYFLSNANGNVGGDEPIYPNLLCSPYPVVGSGLFNCEFWLDPSAGDPTLVNLVFLVAEVCG